MCSYVFIRGEKSEDTAAPPAEPPAEREALTSKQQSRQRGFKFQKEVRHNDTRRRENDFHCFSSAVAFFFLFFFFLKCCP